MSRRACPFCGEAHPATLEDAYDLAAEPTCEHWIGRFDPDSGFEGNLWFLDDVELKPLRADVEPKPRVIRDTFGEWALVAKHAYAEGFTRYGCARDLLLALRQKSGIRYIRVAGDSVMGWAYTDFFAADPARALEEVRTAAAAIQERMERLGSHAAQD